MNPTSEESSPDPPPPSGSSPPASPHFIPTPAPPPPPGARPPTVKVTTPIPPPPPGTNASSPSAPPSPTPSAPPSPTPSAPPSSPPPAPRPHSPSTTPPPAPTFEPASPPPAPSTTPLAAPAASAARHDLTDILALLDGEPGVDAPTTPTTPTPGVGDTLTDPRDLERPSTASDVVLHPEGGLDFDPTFAPFVNRAVGLAVDVLLVGLAVLPGLLVAGLASPIAIAAGTVLSLIGFAILTVIAARSIASTRQWIGNRVAGTYVVDAINGSNLDVPRAVFRFGTRHLLSPVLFLGFLIALFDGQRRTFHDRLVDSVVIVRRREVWTADDAG